MDKTVRQMLAKRLGYNIGCCRRTRGLTQEQLAEYLEVDTLTVSRYETGNILPPLTVVYMIGRLLNTSIAELTGELPIQPATQAQRLEIWMAGLSPSDCHWIEGIVKQLAERCKQSGASAPQADASVEVPQAQAPSDPFDPGQQPGIGDP